VGEEQGLLHPGPALPRRRQAVHPRGRPHAACRCQGRAHHALGHVAAHGQGGLRGAQGRARQRGSTSTAGRSTRSGSSSSTRPSRPSTSPTCAGPCTWRSTGRS
jgi:hypothetical protein